MIWEARGFLLGDQSKIDCQWGGGGVIRKLQCLGGNQVSILESKRKSSVPPPLPKKNNTDLPKIFVIRDLDLEKIYISWARHVFLIPSLSSGHKTWYRPLLSTSLATRPSSQDSRVKMTGITLNKQKPAHVHHNFWYFLAGFMTYVAFERTLTYENQWLKCTLCFWREKKLHWNAMY